MERDCIYLAFKRHLQDRGLVVRRVCSGWNVKGVEPDRIRYSVPTETVRLLDWTIEQGWSVERKWYCHAAREGRLDILMKMRASDPYMP